MRNLKSLWEQRHDLMPMLRDAQRGDYHISLWTKMAFLGCLLYVIMPFDILPDFIPIIGWSDDATLIFFLTKRIASEIQRYKTMKEKTLRLVRY